MTTSTERANERYVAMRRGQYIQNVATHALRLARKRGTTEAMLRSELDKIANDCPGSPFRETDYEKILKVCRPLLQQS